MDQNTIKLNVSNGNRILDEVILFHKRNIHFNRKLSTFMKFFVKLHYFTLFLSYKHQYSQMSFALCHPQKSFNYFLPPPYILKCTLQKSTSLRTLQLQQYRLSVSASGFVLVVLGQNDIISSVCHISSYIHTVISTLNCFVSSFLYQNSFYAH